MIFIHVSDINILSWESCKATLTEWKREAEQSGDDPGESGRYKIWSIKMLKLVLVNDAPLSRQCGWITTANTNTGRVTCWIRSDIKGERGGLHGHLCTRRSSCERPGWANRDGPAAPACGRPWKPNTKTWNISAVSSQRSSFSKSTQTTEALLSLDFNKSILRLRNK